MDVALPGAIQCSERDIQAAILAIKNNEYPSIRKAAIALNIP